MATQEMAFGVGRPKTAEERARFLFEFARTDLSKLTPGQTADLFSNAWAFPAPFLTPIRPVALTEKNKKTLRQVRSDIRVGLQALKDGHTWKVPGRSPALLLRPHPTRFAVRLYRGSVRQMFLAAVADVLLEIGPKLRRCKNPSCGELFLRQGKLIYCSPACSQKTRWARFVIKHPNRQRKYSKEYLQRLKKRKGQNDEKI